MTKVFLTLALFFTASTAFAAQPGVGYGGTVGALVLETRDVATSPEEVRRQGGFATAGAVRWTNPFGLHHKPNVEAF